MMGSVFAKTLYDKRGFIVGWTLGLLALSMLMASFFPAFRMEGGIDTLIQNMPAAFQGLVGELGALDTFQSYIASQLFDIRMPIIVGAMAIILGLGLSTKEEGGGELRTVLALPISRVSLAMQKWLAMVVIMAIATGGLFAGVLTVVPFLSDATIELGALAELSLMSLLIMVTFGTITYGVGIMTGRRAAANGVSMLVVIGSFLLSTFAVAVEWLERFEFLSILHYFPAVEIAESGVAVANVVILSSIIIVTLCVSIIVFRNRDLS